MSEEVERKEGKGKILVKKHKENCQSEWLERWDARQSGSNRKKQQVREVGSECKARGGFNMQGNKNTRDEARPERGTGAC